MNNWKNGNLKPFSQKYKDKNWDQCPSKKCLRYYSKKTKDENASICITFYYIDEYYSGKKYVDGLSQNEQFNYTKQLLYRYEELEKTSKYSFSIISSVLTSFIISFLLYFLQTPDESGISYLDMLGNYINSGVNFILTLEPLITIIMALIFLSILCLFLGVLATVVILPIIISEAVYYNNSVYKNIIVPYEKKVIIDTLSTYDKRYESIK